MKGYGNIQENQVGILELSSWLLHRSARLAVFMWLVPFAHPSA